MPGSCTYYCERCRLAAGWPTGTRNRLNNQCDVCGDTCQVWEMDRDELDLCVLRSLALVAKGRWGGVSRSVLVGLASAGMVVEDKQVRDVHYEGGPPFYTTWGLTLKGLKLIRQHPELLAEAEGERAPAPTAWERLLVGFLTF